MNEEIFYLNLLLTVAILAYGVRIAIRSIKEILDELNSD
jgi:hypothetical protein